MTALPIILGITKPEAQRYAETVLGLRYVVTVSRPEHLDGLTIEGPVYETPAFWQDLGPTADLIRRLVATRRTIPEPAKEPV